MKLDESWINENNIFFSSIINKCSDFTIKSLDEEEIEKEEMDIAQVYTYDKLEPYCLMDNLEVASDDESANNDNISRSFPTFRKKMSNITVDGKVMKLVTINYILHIIVNFLIISLKLTKKIVLFKGGKRRCWYKSS